MSVFRVTERPSGKLLASKRNERTAFQEARNLWRPGKAITVYEFIGGYHAVGRIVLEIAEDGRSTRHYAP